MLFSKESLQASYDRVKDAVQSKTVIPVLSTIRIIVKDNNYQMIASNSLYQITSIGECEGNDDFDFCFPADKFGIMLSAAKDEIEIVIDGMTAKTKSHRSKFNLNLIEGEQFPIIKYNDNFDNGINLKEIIGNVYLCAPSKDVRPILNGVCLQSDGFEVNAIATDGRMMAAKTTQLEIEEFDQIIPLDIAKILAEHDSNGFNFEKDKAISVKFVDGSILTGKVIDGKFPQWRQLLKFDPDSNFTVNSVEFKKAVDIANKVASKASKDKAIRLSTKDSFMKVAATALDGNVESEIECNGGDFVTTFNSELLFNAISIIKDDQITIEYDKSSKFFYKSDDTSIVMMPLRA